MPDYRCYLLSGDNKIVAVKTAIHPNDQSAIEWAEGVLDEEPGCAGIELWTRARLVHRKMR